MVLVSLGGIALAMWGKSLMELLDVALSIQLVALFVPVVMGIYGRPRGVLPGVLSMLAGLHGLARQPSRSSTSTAGCPRRSSRRSRPCPRDFWGLGFAILGYAVGQALLDRGDPSIGNVNGCRTSRTFCS